MSSEAQANVPGDNEPDTTQGAAAPGSEANASGPVPQEDTLTVEDILGTEQSPAAAAADGAADPAGDAAEAADAAAAASDAENPYLEDLRRLTAEYANYRKRTEANAQLEKQRAVAAAVAPLLPVLDDLDRAEQHGDLQEGSAFFTIAQKLRTALSRMGLESFGEKGEEFDPQKHEAIAQVPFPGAAPGSIVDVIERGYRIGDVELRPAKVAVAVE